MKAFILAAGMGTRISRYIEEKPKCMLDIGGTTLLQYTIDLLKSRGINNIIICVGYRADYIMARIKDDSVKFVNNPFYDVTNGIATMWFAREYMTAEDTIIMSGDLYIEPSMLDELIKCKEDPVMIADSTRITEADYRFRFENSILIKHGKDLSIEETTGENLGIVKMSADFVREYKSHMCEMIEQQKHSLWWESVMYDMIPHTKIYIHDIAGKYWHEIDRVEDYKDILKHRGIIGDKDVQKN